MMLKKVFINIILFFITFVIISLVALPILFDLIFSALIIYFFRKKISSILILNCLVVIMVVVINLGFGKNEKHGYFYRAHEKYATKEKKYEKNISDTIFMRYGDIYFKDGGLNKRRDHITEARKQNFVTDAHGLRNDRFKLEDSEIILVGDSFISAQGTSQEYTPANILGNVSKKKVATLSWSGVSPKDYEELIEKYLDILRKDAKIFVFYFEGNDFEKINIQENNNSVNTSKYVYWRGYKIPKWKAVIRFAYERLERNKDKFLLKVFSEKNYFLRNIRAKTHLFNRKILTSWTNTGSPIQYFKIGEKTVGFYYRASEKPSDNFSTYIPKEKKVISRISAVFFIPTKVRVYSKYVGVDIEKTSQKFQILKKKFNLFNIPVHDLSVEMKNSVPSYLSEGKYLFWRDDTHWNNYGIFVAMNYIDKITKK
tara:strand:- start:2432 stop:3712 length:1281 start_codon:yes stop_codon:yes gene_type:complete